MLEKEKILNKDELFADNCDTLKKKRYKTESVESVFSRWQKAWRTRKGL